MKQSLLLIAFLVFCNTSLRAQDKWVKYKEDNRVTVQYPSEPKSIGPGSHMALQDSSAVYIFTIVNFKDYGVDSAALAPVLKTQDFADQLKSGLVKSMTDVTVDDIKIGQWRGLTSYTTAGTDLKGKMYNMLMFVIGNKLYSATAIRKAGIETKGRDYFFEAIELTN